MANRSLAVSNLVQGVSQQAAQARRTSQAEEQFDMLNQPVEGAVARSGFDIIKRISTGNFEGYYHFEILRDIDEKYEVYIGGGDIKVFNMVDGTECTVTKETGAAAYLTCVGSPDGAFKATTAEDVTFIANRERIPAMNPALVSPSRPKEALFYQKAGGYKTSYTITITYSGVDYSWTYTTPDNSVSANEQYIKTDAIAYSLYNAMITDPTNPITGMGFSSQRTGSLIRIWRTSGDFDVDVQDGQGNTHLLGFKESVSGFDKLPQGGFNGMVLRVSGDASKDDEDDYYVQFIGKTSTGVWEECPKPAMVINFLDTTMPHRLVNTGVNTFTFGKAPWGARVAGDTISAKDPSFVGKKITELSFDNARLLIVTSGTAVWSRTNNPYVFFPDTVQAKLATAPIDYEVRASRRIAILKTVLQTDDASFLWAENRQFIVTTADLPFTAENVAVKPSTSFDFNDRVVPVPVGRSVLFCVENGPWSSLVDLTIQEGRAIGDLGLTDHAPKYVPSNLRWMVATDTSKKALLYSLTAPDRLYLYEWALEAKERIQSAWSTWRLPEGCTILNGTFDRNVFYLTVQRDDGVYLMKTSVAPFQSDPEGNYVTRLDMRIRDDDMDISWNAGTGFTRLELPYRIYEETSLYRFVTRETVGDILRGESLPVDHWAVESGVSVAYIADDYTSAKLYGGFRISSEREESTFYVRDQNDIYVEMDRVQVQRIAYAHADTGYYRIEVLNQLKEVIKFYEFFGRRLGDPANTLDSVVLDTNTFEAPIGLLNTDFSVRVVNDSFLPSSLQTSVWDFTGKA